jgi:hypothetical protein
LQRAGHLQIQGLPLPVTARIAVAPAPSAVIRKIYACETWRCGHLATRDHASEPLPVLRPQPDCNALPFGPRPGGPGQHGKQRAPPGLDSHVVRRLALLS